MQHFTDAQLALGFVVPQMFNIEAEVYQTKYPSFDYASYLPVITEGNPWARGTVFYSGDLAGAASYLSGKGFDMPYVNNTRSQFLTRHHLAGIGYEVTLEEINVAAMEGRNIDAEDAADARKIAEQFIFFDVMTGKLPGAATSEKGKTGLLNDPNVPVSTATGTFASSTPDQILAMINSLIEGVHTVSQKTEMADTLILPFANFSYISRTRTGSAGDSSIMKFLRENNSYTAETGQPLNIRTQRLLVGAGGSNTNRMVAYKNSRDVLRYHLPMPFQFLEPYKKNSMTIANDGIFRVGGTEIRLPKSVAYMDGI